MNYVVMRNFFWLFCVFVAVGWMPVIGRAADASLADVNRVALAVRNFYFRDQPEFAMGDTAVATTNSHTEQFLTALHPDGSWPDIAYADKNRSAWPAAAHPERMLQLVIAAHAAPAAKHAQIMANVHRAFGFWLRHDFQCPNWWFNQIGIPKAFATIGVLMDDELLPAEKEYLLNTMMPRSQIAMTGQNRLWLAGNTLLAGLIAPDPEMVRRASDTIWAQIHVATTEGVQPDNSFHQHGAQQQFGNYGLAFADEINHWSDFLAGTAFTMPEAKKNIMRNYLFDGLAWVVWRGAMDPGACDRQITPNCQPKKGADVAVAIAGFARIDPAHALDCQAYATRNQSNGSNDLVGDRYFYRSDALFHRLPDLFLSLKMSSKRVIGTEVVNGENQLGYHTADGMLLVQRSGAEYQDVFPLWDWKQIPGVTAAQTPLPHFSTTFVPADFVGAVSDGVHGVAAMAYARDGVVANKAWFFGNEGVVALGAAISSKVDSSIITGVNMAWLHGAVMDEGIPTVGQGRLTTPGFVEHDGIRYTFPIMENVMLATNRVTGNWQNIYNNPKTPQADVAGDLFSLNIDHGKNPVDQAYAYSIGLAGKNPGSVIRQNTSRLQAVQFADGVIGIVFETPGTFTQNDLSLVADKPCVVILNVQTKKLFAADPTQKLKSLHFIFNGKDFMAELPVGANAGSTVSIVL
jgi:chondroitin AC lyase